MEIWSEGVDYFVFSASKVFRVFELSELGQIRKSVVGWNECQTGHGGEGSRNFPSRAHPWLLKRVQSKQRSSEFCAVSSCSAADEKFESIH